MINVICIFLNTDFKCIYGRFILKETYYAPFYSM